MKNEKWLVQAKQADFETIGKRFSISPIIARIIRNRDHVTEEEIDLYLNGNEKQMYSPWLMKDMEKGVEILRQKIREKKKIRVIGDYDIDGVCATYILVDGIRKAGGDASMEIPDRVKDGYGINENLIQKAYDDGMDTIVTCDNGIAAIEQIAYAKSLGMTVIVTDHHEVPYVDTENGRTYLRVAADAVINPKQEECQYPFPLLCGGAIAYKFLQALYIKEGMIADDASVILDEYIEFAAIATIGDVVDLYGENRIIAKLGLARIQDSKNLGLRALIEANDIKDEITSYHIGFVIGPCLNASGRLETAKEAFDLLNAKEVTVAMKKASYLKELNDKRKALTEQGVELALMEAENYQSDKILVIYLPTVHESIAGIIAGRVRENLNKPVFVLTNAEDGVKGSGRSIESCNMFEELTSCRDLLTKFGGHAMAAGLSLEKQNVDILRKRLNQQTKLTDEDLVEKVWIDVAMPFEYINESFMKQLKVLEPFGKGNPKPVFAQKNLKIRRINVIGQNQNSLKMTLVNERGVCITALCFNRADEFFAYIGQKFGDNEWKKAQMGQENAISLSIIYYPQINEYNGQVEYQVIMHKYL